MNSLSHTQLAPVISGLACGAAGAQNLAEGNIQKGTVQTILGMTATQFGTVGYAEPLREAVLKTNAITSTVTVACQGLYNLWNGQFRKGALQLAAGISGTFALTSLPSRAVSVASQTISIAALWGLIAYQGIKDLAQGHFKKGLVETAFGVAGIAVSGITAYSELSSVQLGDHYWHHQPLASGVSHYTFEGENQRLQLLKIDPTLAEIRVQDARGVFRENEHPSDDRLILTELTSRVPKAIASVNGGFFHYNPPNGEYYLWNGPYVNGDPIGELIVDGKPLFQNPPYDHWGTFRVSHSGQVSISNASAPSDTRFSLGAAPLLIQNGQIATEFGQPAPFLHPKHVATPGAFQYHMNTPHGRTAVCQDGDNQLLLVTAEGRMKGATGYRISEFSHLLHSLGCKNALNMDGGGSVDLATITPQGTFQSTVAALDPNGKRPVATALVVTKRD